MRFMNMNIKERVIELVIRNHRMAEKDFFEKSSIPADELKSELKEIGLLDFKERSNFFWKLQNELERYACEYAGLDMDELVDIFVKNWNAKEEVKITPSNVLSFYSEIHLKFPNSHKALAYLSEGDLSSYKMFAKNNKIIVDLFMRFAICNLKRMGHIIVLAEELLPRMVSGLSKSDYFDSLDRLGFLRNDRKMIFGKMSVYKSKVGNKGLVFSDGLRAILLEVTTDNEVGDIAVFRKHLQLIKENEQLTVEESDDEEFTVDDLMESYVEEANGAETLKPEKTPDAPLKVKEPVQVVEIEKKSSDNKGTDSEKSEQQEPNKAVTLDKKSVADGENLEVQPTEENVDKKEVVVTSKTELEEDLDEILQKVKSTLEKAQKEKAVESARDEDELNRLKIAEEENARLKAALQHEKERVVQTEEKLYTKIFEAIGGKSSNYLLSDLFEETEGKLPDNRNISTGRLVNLFSNLEVSMGLEAHNEGLEVGEEFTVEKDHLIKNFMVDGPVTSSEEKVTVKMMKYGWSINGKVIVQPLVKEAKEEN